MLLHRLFPAIGTIVYCHFLSHRSPLTPESIIREFRATSDRRLPACDLIKVLVSISEKRPNFAEVTKEISHILQNKDPMYALLVFVERYSECKPVSESSSSTSLSAMGLPHGNKTSDVNSAAGSVPTTLAIASTSTILTTSQNVSGSTRLSLTQSQDFPTSTPVNCKKATESDTTPVVFVRRGPMDRNRGAGKDERNDLSVVSAD